MRLWPFLLLLLVACEADPTPSSTAPPPNTSVAPAKVTSSAKAKPTSPHVGDWTGTFVAEKTEVDVPKKARWKWWEKEEGDVATGKGEVRLRIDADGRVEGRTTGALGEMDAAGAIDKGAPGGPTLRVALSPSDPEAETAMTGWLIGRVEATAIKGELRVSDHTGNVVRKAPIALQKSR